MKERLLISLDDPLLDKVLDRREKRILLRRFVEGCTLDECGRPLGIGRERVRQILRKALPKLERALAPSGNQQFLDNIRSQFENKNNDSSGIGSPRDSRANNSTTIGRPGSTDKSE